MDCCDRSYPEILDPSMNISPIQVSLKLNTKRPGHVILRLKVILFGAKSYGTDPVLCLLHTSYLKVNGNNTKKKSSYQG